MCVHACARQKGNDAVAEEDKEEPIKRKIPFEACFQAFCSDTMIRDYMSPVTGAKGHAAKNTRFKRCPKYLTVHLQRYIMAEDWTPKKLECNVMAPETLDLSQFVNSGQQPGEELMPEDAASSAAAAAGVRILFSLILPDKGPYLRVSACRWLTPYCA